MPYIRCLAPAVAFAVFIGFVVSPSRADTILGGSYNNSPNPPGDGDGYDATNGSFTVLPTATFDSNGSDGLDADDGATVTVTGGQFQGNDSSGIGIYPTSADNATVSVSGGTFANNAEGILDTYGVLNVSGGNFTGNDYDIVSTYESTITITGGSYSATRTDFYVEPGTTSFDVYGQFTGMTPGQTDTLYASPISQSFTGTLEYGTASQTFTYNGDTTGGTPTIVLHDVALVPEPATAAVSIAMIGILTLRRRRRAA